MHPARGLVLVLPVLVGAAGCERSGPGPEPAGGPAPAPAVADGPAGRPSPDWLENPEYRHWTQFPVGTTVVREKQVTSDGGAVHVTTTLKLVEKSDRQVTVESLVRVVRDGQPLPTNPPQPLVYPARFPLPEGLEAAAFERPSLKARPAGTEALKIGPQEFLAEVFTWQEVNETGPMQVTYWRHDQVPGRMVRQEIHGPNHDSVEQVTQMLFPSSEKPPPAGQGAVEPAVVPAR